MDQIFAPLKTPKKIEFLADGWIAGEKAFEIPSRNGTVTNIMPAANWCKTHPKEASLGIAGPVLKEDLLLPLIIVEEPKMDLSNSSCPALLEFGHGGSSHPQQTK